MIQKYNSPKNLYLQRILYISDDLNLLKYYLYLFRGIITI